MQGTKYNNFYNKIGTSDRKKIYIELLKIQKENARIQVKLDALMIKIEEHEIKNEVIFIKHLMNIPRITQL